MKKPFHPGYWSGRVDVEDGLDGKRWHQIIKEFPNVHEAYLEKPVVFLGFCSDEGVKRNQGRAGAAKAPEHIRKFLSALPIRESVASALFDDGDVIVVGHELEEARKEQIAEVRNILKRNALPIVLGGGHETAFGNYLALESVYDDFGIINFDAHFDLRIPHPNSTSGTPFYEMAKEAEKNNRKFNYLCVGIQNNSNTKALFNRAKDFGVQYLTAEQVHANEKTVHETIDRFVGKNKRIYLSLDMDVFDSAFAPGVSAPAINGLSPYAVQYLLKKIAASGKICLIDVVETNPELDIDNRTSRLASYMISELVHSL